MVWQLSCKLLVKVSLRADRGPLILTDFFEQESPPMCYMHIIRSVWTIDSATRSTLSAFRAKLIRHVSWLHSSLGWAYSKSRASCIWISSMTSGRWTKDAVQMSTFGRRLDPILQHGDDKSWRNDIAPDARPIEYRGWRADQELYEGFPSEVRDLDQELANRIESLQVQIDIMKKRRELDTNVKIEACVLWDTVSALVRPGNKYFKPKNYTKYKFVNAQLPSGVNHVFHALALNEKRWDFKPVIFTSPPDGTTLAKTWFLGCHSDVGGGNSDIGLSNISLNCMIAQLETKTHLTMSKAWRQFAPNFRRDQDLSLHVAAGKSVSNPELFDQDAFVAQHFAGTTRFRQGKIDESYKGFFVARGEVPRRLAPYFSSEIDLSVFEDIWFRIRRTGRHAASRIWGWVPESVKSRLPWHSSQASSAKAENDSERDQSDASECESDADAAELAARPTIHFTVRLLLEHKHSNAECPILSDHKVEKDTSDTYTWRDQNGRTKNSSLVDLLTEFEEEVECVKEVKWKLFGSVVREEVPTRNELALMGTWFIAEHLVIVDEAKLGTTRVVDIAGYGLYVDGRKTLAQFLQPFVLGILETPPATHVNAVQKETSSVANCKVLHRKLNVEFDRLTVQLTALAADQRTSKQSVVHQTARKVQDARGEQTKLSQLIFGNHILPLSMSAIT